MINRWRIPLLLLGCGFGTLSASITASAGLASPSPVESPAPSSAPNPTAPPSPEVLQLQAQVADLEQQILALQLQSAPLQAQAIQSQQRAAQAQAELATDQLDLASANAQLAHTTASLTAVQGELATDRTHLAALIVTRYVTTTSNSALRLLANSKSLDQTLDTLVSYSQITDSMNTLVQRVHASEDQLQQLDTEQRAEQQQIQQQVTTVQSEQAQALQDESRYQQQAAQLTGPAAKMTQELQALLAQLAAAEGLQIASVSVTGATGTLDGALPPFALGPRVDDFPWGQCTWYVASLRDVAWGGDAWQWAASAAAQGEQEGMVPKPGAIVVFAPGNGYSDVGHVAYVESVVTPTSFIIDEANYTGLGLVDKRLIPTLDGVEAFIY
ncbi:MAG: CHAP domain-containing protein [Candidatus Dormibacteraeota bacterium]|nr:CHAP domain-containing protein [Candidatus Dormibacteraeota bacterium]